MKKNQSKVPPSWTTEADRRFGASPLGKQVVALLTEGSKSQRNLSEFILRDPVFVATHGIEDLAQSTGISPSTISRYVRDLGMSNFIEFRSAVAETVHALIAPVTKLGDRLTRGEPGSGTVEASLGATLANLQALMDPDTAEAVRRVSKRIGSAANVWVIGFGFSSHLAAILTLGLQPYRDGVVNVVGFGGTEVAAARLMSAGRNDLVIAIAFPRYSADITDLAGAARTAGAHLAAITDSNAAPLARIADDLLLAPAQHPVLSSSSVAGLVLIEALVADFLLSDPEHVARAARLAASMAAYLSPGG